MRYVVILISGGLYDTVEVQHVPGLRVSNDGLETHLCR